MKKFIIIGYKYKEGSQKPVIKGNPIIIDFEYEPLEKKSKFFQFLTNVKGK